MHPRFISQIAHFYLPWHTSAWHGPNHTLLDLDYWPTFTPDQVIQEEYSLWRYASVLPVDLATRVSFGEGLTPLIELNIGGKVIHCKLDYLFPSGSYKDRGAAVLMSYAKEIGVQQVVQDSSGNAGASIAHYAARAEITCQIFVPADTTPAKLTQIRAAGADLQLVPGSRSDTAEAAQRAAQQIFYASHVWHPVFYEGTKTFAYEVCEQLGWKAPDAVVLPAGNGTLLLGCYKGFEELRRNGIISRLPKLIAVQAAHCAPLFHAFHQQAAPAISHSTIAEGIAIANPLRGPQMLEAVTNSEGTFIQVSETEIHAHFLQLAQQGYYVEPTSAAVIAGVSQYAQTSAGQSEQIVSVLTGHGLKAGNKAQKILTMSS